VDYAGALEIVRRLVGDLRDAAPLPLNKGATSYPPNTESGNIKTTSYILEGAGLSVQAVLDEPTAAKLALDLDQGAVVDVGGGTTGVSVVQQGRVVHSGDEATGGVHLSLVLAGGYGIEFDQAEKLKTDKSKSADILPVVRPVIDKISTIIERQLRGYDVDEIWLVGGTCELDGMCEAVAENLGRNARRPEHPQVVTPYGIALSGLNGHGKAV
jgi:ethanolamine utilization protein EutJ